MSSQKFRTCIQVQNKCKTVSESFLQNAHKSFSMKPNLNNCKLHTMAQRFDFFWKDRSFVSKFIQGKMGEHSKHAKKAN